jgi:hypothetical protein
MTNICRRLPVKPIKGPRGNSTELVVTLVVDIGFARCCGCCRNFRVANAKPRGRLVKYRIRMVGYALVSPLAFSQVIEETRKLRRGKMYIVELRQCPEYLECWTL